MKTLLLAAGGSVAYADAGFYYPKNLTEVAGAPLLSHVMTSLGPLGRDGRLVVVVPDDEVVRFHTDRVIALEEPTAAVVRVGETSGAACSALLAAERFDPDEELVVVNGDQIIEADLEALISRLRSDGYDAGTIVFDAVHPRWSYVRLEDDRVVQASEKTPISRQATAGVFWFRRAGDFLDAAMSMVMKGASVEGTYYVCPCLNELVLAGRRIGAHPIDRTQYWSFHDPASMTAYEARLRERLVTT